MNILKWIMGTAGKITPTLTQAVVASTAIGGVGIGLWQAMDTPVDNTAFNPAQYNPGEVVYVAGTPGGGSYQSNGELLGGVELIKPSKAIQLQNEEYEAKQRAKMVAQHTPSSSTSEGGGLGGAYQMGGTEGLGMGANLINESGLGGENGLTDFTNPLASVNNIISQVQNGQPVVPGAPGAAGAAAGGEGAAAGGAPNKLASASRNWTASAATGGSGGGSGGTSGSSFVVQSTGPGGKGGAAGGVGGDVPALGDIFKSAQAQAAGMMEGSSVRSRASFGDPLTDPKGSSVGPRGFSDRGLKDLELIHKRSALVANNKNRSVVEGGAPFFDSTQLSGGIVLLDGNEVVSDGTAGSFDLDAPTVSGVKSAVANLQNDIDEREKDKNKLVKWLWGMIGASVAAMLTIPYIKNWTVLGVPVGMILSLIIAAGITTMCVFGMREAVLFARKWGGSGLSTTMLIILPILTGGVWASFFLADVLKNFYDKALEKIGFKKGTAGTKNKGIDMSLSETHTNHPWMKTFPKGG